MDWTNITIAALHLFEEAFWPVAAIRIFSWFKPELRLFWAEILKVIPRIEKAGPTGFSLSPIMQLQDEGSKTNQSETKQLEPLQIGNLTSAEVLLKSEIEQNLSKIEASNQEKIELLLTRLAQSRLEAGHERIYRLIFGSQIEALKTLDNKGRVSFEDAKKSFSNLINDQEYKKFYENYDFYKWSDFLERNRLVNKNNDMFEISQLGEDFLRYISLRNLPQKKW